MRLAIYLFVLSFCLNSCQSSASKESAKAEEETAIAENNQFIKQYFSSVFLPESSSIFRFVNFDDPIEEVKATEANQDLQLADESEGFLQFEKDLFVDTTKGIDYVMIKYIFDSYDRLWVITANYIIQDSVKTNELYDHLNNTFSEKYGDYYFDRDGFTVWEGSYKRNDSVDVVYDLGVRKLLKFADPGIQIELMRFGQL